ncbi:MAG: S8 family serine peptidase [Caldilineaceae bacterium]|nr:S8 family serine peptidase [Caldilineaceae bacterium]
MRRIPFLRNLSAALVFLLLFTQVAAAEVPPPAVSDGSSDVAAQVAQPSPRLIVELQAPPLAAAYGEQVQAASANGTLDINAADAQAYISQLQAEQAAFVGAMQAAVPDATVSTFINETNTAEQATYQVLFNGISVDVGSMDREEARRRLAQIPGVKMVYLDQPYYTQLYTSTALINAPLLWNDPAIGGRENGGAGIKFASVDGGVHKDAPMMDGTGYTYPSGYGPNGLGLTANNNGKIIVSRAYFRPWDPPAPGDENPWPGENGTSHGMHTSSTAAGEVVTDVTYLGLNIGTISGVAPRAYVMSYRVFYASVNGIESFYTTEGLAALEDVVKDGADVVNNSWGGGPGSSGGEFDPLDQALINATNAGVFVSMSTGNAGPGSSTSDHPSADYISVAASSTSGTLATGRVSLPTDPALQDIAFASADFGASLPISQVLNYPYLPSVAVNPGNINGCSAWAAGTFTGKAALIQRGDCEYGVKVLNAEQAGADFIVIYNHAAGGNEIVNMAPGAVGDQVTKSSIFIGHDNGVALVNYYTAHSADNPATAIIQISTSAFQKGNDPDRIVSFSSRGPGVGNTLKPDITAPGVNILAQGYAPNVTGEARHLGYGQVSGTSMASPHVAGAAALVLQAHPNWSPAYVKSALMSTSKYMDIYLADGTTPAQPLDMGAGRLDLTHVIDPGVILDPPSLSFGLVPTGTQQTIGVMVTSVANAAETYNLSTLYTGDGFTQTTSLPGFTVEPASLSLAPGETKTISVTFNSATGQGLGENQGYILLDGPTHDAHMPAWARATHATALADVLILDNDFSDVGPLVGYFNSDYLWYYTNALEELGYTYEVVNYDLENLPDPTTLLAYKAILYFTGDNYVTAAGFSIEETDRLTEYLNNGGALIAMGQDLAATLNADAINGGSGPFFYGANLGANWLQDSVTDEQTPTTLILPANDAPQVFQDLAVDLTKTRAYIAEGELSGDEETPPVNTDTSGDFFLYYDRDANRLEFSVTVMPTDTTPITVTGAHIHTGAPGVAGPVIRDLADIAGLTLPVFVTDSLTLSGVVTPSLTTNEITDLFAGNLYINVHTTANPGGEVRDQIELEALINQPYIDEVDNELYGVPEAPAGGDDFGSVPVLYYPGIHNLADGTVALVKREQPSLENPGITYLGRTAYTTFGLEGMSNTFNASLNVTPTTRSELLGTLLDWTWANPSTAIISDTTPQNGSLLTMLTATLAEGEAVSYRWDFGDGTPYSPSQTTPEISHVYAKCSTYDVRAEVTDTYGNVTIGTHTIVVDENCSENSPNEPTPQLILPGIYKNP